MNEENSEPAGLPTAYFKNLCDTAGVALLSMDTDLIVTYYNDKAVELFDVPEDRLVGSPFGRIIEQERHGLIERLAEQAISQGECSDFELRHQESNGRARFLAVTISPIGDYQGTRVGASACIRDITRRIHLQDKLSHHRKMRALGALAGNLAHHFNNILGSVVTSVDFAKESNDPRILQRTLKNTAAALQRATNLLEGLLAFAQADHQDDDLADLTETVLHFADRIEPELAKKNISLDLKLARIPIIEVPVKHFLTILNNVGSNAIEALPEGGRLSIELEASKHEAICRISDSGGGISRKDLERVFEPFYSTKEGDAPSQPCRHTGLGLSVALGMVQEMGGELSITSHPNHVTVVEIQLPTDPDHPLHPKEEISEQCDLFPSNDPLNTS